MGARPTPTRPRHQVFLPGEVRDAAAAGSVVRLDGLPRPPRSPGPRAELAGGFALSPAAAFAGDARILDADRYYDGAGPVTWRSNAFTRQAQAGGPIDSVRVSVAEAPRTAAIAPLTLVRPNGDNDADAYDVRDVDVTVTRGWPSAVSLKGRKFALDVTPHAGVGFGGAGGSAEAQAPPCVWAGRRTWATG
ncbi:hypothetical protein ACRAWD_24155 [Caulobacter segnis]